VACPRIEGGYKALRRFCVESVERLSDPSSLTLIAGKTGVGKTDLLRQLKNHIDLEALANHRGSAFGRHLNPQPAVIDFENQLVINWLRLEVDGVTQVVMEDESRCIGSCSIPLSLWQAFEQCTVVVLEDSLESRACRIRKEYIDQQLNELKKSGPTEYLKALQTLMQNALGRISRRLGGVRYAAIEQLMEQAFYEQRKSGHSQQHEKWISVLLSEYYDPMYEFQLASKKNRIEYSGDFEQVLRYFNQLK